MSGHLVEGCDGKWISIGSMVDPDLQKCVKCRGIRRSKSQEVAEEFVPEGLSDRQRLDAQGVPFGIFIGLVGMLVGLVLAAIGFAIYLSVR